MLRYRFDVLEALKNAGYSQYILRKEKLLGGMDLCKLRNGEMLGSVGIENLCNLLKCQPGTLLEWIPDERAKKEGKE